MTQFNAFLIDPYVIRKHLDFGLPLKEMAEQCIREVQITKGAICDYYYQLSEPGLHEVSTFTSVYLGYADENMADDTIYVDDDGLLNHAHGWFVLRGYPQPLAGKGLVLGTTRSGNSCSPRKATLEWLRKNVLLGFECMSFDFRNPQGLGIHICGVAKAWSDAEVWNRKEAWA